MPQDCRTFTDITPDDFMRMTADIRARGFAFPRSKTGTFELKGVRAEYSYDPKNGTLEVRIVKKPALLPASILWNGLGSALAKYRV